LESLYTLHVQLFGVPSISSLHSLRERRYFDYALPRHALPSNELDARDELAARVESIGEPFRLFFTPSEIREELTLFQLIEDLDTSMLNERYFANRTDPLSLRGRSANIICAWR